MIKLIKLSNKNKTIILSKRQLDKLSKDEIKLKLFLLQNNIKWKMLHSINNIRYLPHFLLSFNNLGHVYLNEDVEWHIELKDGTYINTKNINDILKIIG